MVPDTFLSTSLSLKNVLIIYNEYLFLLSSIFSKNQYFFNLFYPESILLTFLFRETIITVVIMNDRAIAKEKETKDLFLKIF